MKQILAVSAVAMAAALSIATPPSFATHSGDPTIQTIRAEYAAINRACRQPRGHEVDLFGYPTEGGGLTGYVAGPSACKLEATFYGCSFHSVEEYYFWNDRLIFVLRTRYEYDRPLGNVPRSQKDRFYFDHGRLIRWIGPNGAPRDPRGAAAADEREDLLTDATDFRARLAP